ncbi:MAG: hypothetical protein FI734_06995 [SAR202 cluster bacterium]|nr:hypothetical protein [SAR202 cluster bacterium]
MRQSARKPWWKDPSLATMISLLTLVTTLVVILKGLEGITEGSATTIQLFWQAGPALALGFILAGLLTVLFPPATVGKWMGDDASVKGFLIGAAAGALSPGGPYVMYPIAAALMHGGAGIGSIAAFTAARNMFTVNRFLVYEVPFLGIPLSLARTFATIWLVLVSIILVPMVFRMMPRSAQEAARAKIGKAEQESE